jgi:exodeoxyribonuclease-5
MATDVRLGNRVVNGEYGVNKDGIKLGKDVIQDTALLARADIILCHTNATRQDVNTRVRAYKGFTDNYPEVGDKLICRKNNKSDRMFNGLIVFVKAVRLEDSFLIMDLVDEAGTVYNNIKSFTNYFLGYDHPKLSGKVFSNVFEFGYCVTYHASQGSEWDTVVVIEEGMHKSKVSERRRAIYTALTRASNKVYWISKHK